MNLYKSDKSRFILGVILLIISYSIYYICFEENARMKSLDRILQYFIKFLFTLFAYLIGSYHLGKLRDEWMSFVWHFIHISGLCIITIIGLYDWLISDISLSTLLFAATIQEFLISPMLYLAMGLLNRSLNKK